MTWNKDTAAQTDVGLTLNRKKWSSYFSKIKLIYIKFIRSLISLSICASWCCLLIEFLTDYWSCHVFCSSGGSWSGLKSVISPSGGTTSTTRREQQSNGNFSSSFLSFSCSFGFFCLVGCCFFSSHFWTCPEKTKVIILHFFFWKLNN